MAKIHVVMSTGHEFTISRAFYGAEGAMDTQDAQIQGKFLITKMALVGTDQGPVINSAQVSHFWVTD